MLQTFTFVNHVDVDFSQSTQVSDVYLLVAVEYLMDLFMEMQK